MGMILPALVLVLLEIAGPVTANADNDQQIDYYQLYEGDTGLSKRAAYSYVSEYKRLPVYNFGLGKRSPGEERRLNSFGLGKRSQDEDGDYEDDIKDEYNKRMKQYSFGLGKRAPKQYSFGLGKKANGKHWNFGVGKRIPYLYESSNYEDSDATDILKRAGENGRLYSFGLGKRDDEPRQGRSMMYNFGLGKRGDGPQPEKDTSSSHLVN